MILWKILQLIWAGFNDRDIEPVPESDVIDLPPRVHPPEPDLAAIPPTEPITVETAPTEPIATVSLAEDYGPATVLVRAMKAKGYEVFENNEKDLNLNIVGIRDTGARLDEFSCKICVFWKTAGGDWKLLEWKATTYPGSRYLVEKLLNSRGAAILVPGQYPVYRLDTHNGKYEAVCQRRGPVKVYRDGNRDRKFDLNPSSVMSGNFGMNIHAAVTPRSGFWTYIAQRVYAASAGCQVFQRVADFLEFRSLCQKAAELWGNAFTYTLLEDVDLHQVDVEDPEPITLPDPDQFDTLEEWDPSREFDTLGVRQKNLLNVKGADEWRYSLGRDERGHHRFPSFEKGLRAGIINLRSYWTRHKLRTIADILARWAPASDTVGSIPGAPANSPVKYAKFVSSRAGHAPTAPLSLFTEGGEVKDVDQLYAVVAAMVAFENDADLQLPRDVFDGALRLV